MTDPHAPRCAVALLRHFSTDPALVGDLIEEYESGRSRLWLWRQVAVTLALVLSGRAHEPAPHRARTINLATTPKGSPVGGVGLLAIVVLVAVVSPQAWWLLGVGVGGGALLGAMLIQRSRRRERERPPRARTGILLTGLVLLAAPVMHAAHSGQHAVPPGEADAVKRACAAR